jgi:hypothetical protein
MNETNSSWISTTGNTYINGGHAYTATPRVTLDNWSGLPNHNLNILNNSLINSNNMTTKQVKAAVFTIERNDKNQVISSKFVKELWVEVKNGASLDLAVAKELKGDFDPETTVVREILTVTFN